MTETTPKIVGHISFQLDIEAAMVEDLLITGIEDGIGYWCNSVMATGKADDSPSAGIHLCEGGALEFDAADEIATLTLPTFIAAIGRFCKEKNQSPQDLWEQHDAADADLIIQYALFNEHRYD